MEIQPGPIALAIQLAITPALLLVGIATFVRILADRMGRIVDRQRDLKSRAGAAGGRAASELSILARRMHLINRAVALAAASALLICIVVVALFLTDLIDTPFNRAIAALFAISMAALIGSFVYFLREIFLATATLPLWLRRGKPMRRSG